MSVRLSVSQSARNKTAATGRIVMKFYIYSISSWVEWRTLITHPTLEMAYGGKCIF